MIAGVSLAGKTLLQQLELTSAATPHALAVLAPGREPLSVSQLERTVKTMACDLYGLGYGAGDRIAVAALPWGAESAVGGLGVAVTATVVTVDSRSTADELESWFGRTGADAVMVHTKLDSPARAVAVRMGLPLIDLIPREGAPAGSVTVAGEAVRQGEAPRAVSPDDLIVIGGTSGTTGRPKAIGITQREMTTSLGAFLVDAGSSRGLAVAPLGGLTTFSFYVASLAFGSSIVFPSALEPSRLLEWLLEFEIDQFAGNRPVLEALLAAARAHPELVARCGLKRMSAGGSEIPPNLIAEAERTFGAPFMYGYAMTETGSIAMFPPGSTGERPGSVGKPMVELRIVSETGAPVPQGAAGEVEVKGPRVIEEYFDDPEATQNAFHDGWFRTGDVGYLDADGYLYISGRVKEMINRGGDKVLPPEVDDALMSHPAVADAAAFPIPHRTLGEEVAAAVVWTDGGWPSKSCATTCWTAWHPTRCRAVSWQWMRSRATWAKSSAPAWPRSSGSGHIVRPRRTLPNRVPALSGSLRTCGAICSSWKPMSRWTTTSSSWAVTLCWLSRCSSKSRMPSASSCPSRG